MHRGGATTAPSLTPAPSTTPAPDPFAAFAAHLAAGASTSTSTAPAVAHGAAADSGKPGWPTITLERAMLGLLAAMACLVLLPQLFALVQGAGSTRSPATVPTAPATAATTEPVGIDPAALSHAQELVFQSRTLLEDGRFADADALIADIAGELSDATGASALRDEIYRARQRATTLRQSALDAEAAGDWPAVRSTIAEIATFMPLDAELQRLDRRAAAAIKAQATEVEFAPEPQPAGQQEAEANAAAGTDTRRRSGESPMHAPAAGGGPAPTSTGSTADSGATAMKQPSTTTATKQPAAGPTGTGTTTAPGSTPPPATLGPSPQVDAGIDLLQVIAG